MAGCANDKNCTAKKRMALYDKLPKANRMYIQNHPLMDVCVCRHYAAGKQCGFGQQLKNSKAELDNILARIRRGIEVKLYRDPAG